VRELIRDAAAQPVENLCTNPSFERAVAGATIVRRNLATNPNFERAVAGTTIVRRNLWAGVRAQTGATGATITPAVVDGRSGDTFTQSASNASAIYRLFVALDQLVNGLTYTVSATVKNIGSEPATIALDWADTAPTVTYTLAAGETRRVSATGSRRIYDSIYRFGDIAVPTLGATIHVSERLIEARPGALPFFNGATPNDRGIAYEWEGAANASPSVAKAAVVEVRRNLFTNPSFEDRPIGSGGSAYYSFSGQGNSFVADGRTGNVGWRFHRTTGVGGLGAALHGYRVLVSAGRSYTFSYYVRPGVDSSPWVASIAWGSVNAYPTDLGSTTGAATATAAGGWTRVSVTGVAPEGAIYAWVVCRSNVSTYAEGASAIIDDLLFEESSSLGAHFDGATTPDADLAPAWIGAEGASVSVLYGLALPQIQQYSGRVVYGTPRGDLCIAPEANATNETSGYGAIVYSNDRFKAGYTYTALATVRLEAPISGSLDSWRALRLYVSRGAAVPSVAAQFPNVAGSHTVRITFTVPAGGNLDLRLGHGGLRGSGNLYLERLTLVEGVDAGPHFDGDTIDSTGIAYSWESTAHGSASVGRAAVVEVRRNLAPNPLAVTGGTSYFAQTPGGYTVTNAFVAGSGPNGESASALTVASSDGSSQAFRTRIGGSSSSIWTAPGGGVASAQVALSFDLWVPAALAGKQMSVEIPVVDPTGTGNFQNSYRFTPVAGWTRVAFALEVTPRNTQASIASIQTPQLVTGSAVGAVGDVMARITNVTFELASSVGSSFSGAMSLEADLFPAWTGTENASPSVLQGLRTSQVIVTSSQTTGYLSWDRPERGATVFRSILNTTSNAAIAVGDSSLLASLVEGRTYTILLRARANTRPTQVRPRIRNSDLGTPGNTILPIGVWTTFRLTVVAGSGTAAQTGLLVVTASSGSHQIGDVIDVDRVTVVEGDYKGPYVDGDFRDAVWRGTPHASTSIGYPQLIALQAA